MVKGLICAALLATSSAFAPQPMQTGVAPLTRVNGYVPDGLTEAQYKQQLAKEKAAKENNKRKFPMGDFTLNVADYLIKLECAPASFLGGGERFVRRPPTAD